MRWERLRPGVVTGFKILLLCVMAVALFSQVAGSRMSRTSFGDMETAVLAAADLTPMSPGDNQMLRRIYAIEPEEYEAITLYYPTSSMSVEELLLVKLADAGQQEEIRNAMETRVASQTASFEGYGPDQVAMLGRSVIEVRGNYALLAVADDPEAIRQAFLSAY